jgi:hypothetical protein
MSLSDTRNFLVDLFSRWDPNLDVTEGSDLYASLIEPILLRIGGDPYDDDAESFILTRLQQVAPTLGISEVDDARDLLVNPIRVLLEAVTREQQLIKLRTSLANVSSLADDEVDALMGNFFEARRGGGFAQGVVRAYFASPQTVTVTLVNIATSKSGLRYVVPAPQQITAGQMLLNVQGAEYYFDINYIADQRGDEYNIDPGEINAISNLSASTRATNIRRFENGVARETSEEFVARVQQGTSDKTLTTEPGIVAVLNDNFPALRTVFAIGCGDPEMHRDVIKGGGLGAVPKRDDLGEFFGFGSVVDDGDADDTTPLLSASTGNFVSRVGGAGSTPDGWFVTVVYTAGGQLVVRDSQVTQVVSDTRVKLADEMPVTLGAGAVTWMLRRRRLTISDIPGGIVFPDTPEGTLEVVSDAVHVGGKTDIFVAGPVDAASTQVVGLSDEGPLARGVNARTGGDAGEEVVYLTDLNVALVSAVTPGMSLVLSEGSDVGSYRITAVSTELDVDGTTTVPAVRLDTALTGSQGNLTWKIVDEIDVNLIAPKDVLLEGNDLILSGASNIAIVAGSVNFTGAGIRAGDILFVDHPEHGGDFTITDVFATQLAIDPAAPRALPAAHYVISRRSAGVVTPVLRVNGLELLDSAGAPNGTVIPYRDPVLCVANGFQNEGAEYLFEGQAMTGLLGYLNDPSGWTWSFFNGLTFDWEARDPLRPYAPPVAAGTFAFGLYSGVEQMIAAVASDAALKAAGVRAVLLEARSGSELYFGFASPRLVTIAGGTAIGSLVFPFAAGDTNARVRAQFNADLSLLKVRRGDLVEFVGGANGGSSARVVTTPTASGFEAGAGPQGPSSTAALYDLLPLNPDVAARIRVGHPSVGSVRCYFLAPTSVDFGYLQTRFTRVVAGVQRDYQPDPENLRVVLPPPPLTALPGTAITGATSLVDAEADFFRSGVKQGDLLDIVYRPMVGTDALDDSAEIAVGGQTMFVQLDADPIIEVAFPYAMTRDAIVSYINAQVGETIASIVDDHYVLSSSRRITLYRPTDSVVASTLAMVDTTNIHPQAGTYIIQAVSKTQLTLSTATPIAGAPEPATQYRVRRYTQRVSSTEMNLNLDASGLYYVDVEAVSLTPGNANNIASGVELQVTGYRSDGYRLISRRPELSYSRAEQLYAQLSRSLLLPGASDNPMDYVQLSQQNVQINYERSALADDIQSFCQSRYRRVINEDILIRHLLPHYVSLNWRYVGGLAEPVVTRAILDALAGIEGGGELEVGLLSDAVKRKQASSVYAVDLANESGRAAPFVLLVMHGEDRRIRAALVRDIAKTVRMCTFLPDAITARRVSSSGLR